MVYERIRMLREDNDLKQREIADFLSCSQQTYSNYESGNHDIPVEVLVQLAEFYQTSVDYIVGRTQRREPIK